ncbi:MULTISPECIES: TetR/AcrR family transcriptional regulator [unclassified Microbacterium]|uniref:TetR/AcrR family transcriptional regulator n=1 Tax=unclassified Microbacterium TaxID=2609290 RepID=UPI00364789E2
MVHPNAVRSQRWLTAALLELMREKPFARITISEIADKAQLSRRTFYRNFATKEQILSAYTRDLMEEYIAAVRPVVDRPMRDIVFIHLTFWRRHLEFLRTMQHEQMLFLLLEKYNEYIAEVRDRAGSTRYTELSREEYALAFNAGGHLNVVFEWLRRGAVDDPEAVAATFEGFGDR